MGLLFPHHDFRRIYEIPQDFFASRGIRALLLDVDNTLTTHNNPLPHQEVLVWLRGQQNLGLRLMIISNNHQERVAPFAQALGLEYIADAAKPLPGKVRKTLASWGLTPGQTALIGDQIFTDVLCGRLAGLLTILVEPIEMEPMRFYRIKLYIEKGVLRRYRKEKTR